MKPLTIESFRAWLQGQPDDTEYKTLNGHECPLAVYINEGALVGTITITTLWGARISLPEWAREFVYRVDHCEEVGADYQCGRIKNLTAREILDSMFAMHEEAAGTGERVDG